MNTYTAGVELPATGGTGTLPYTLTGLTLLLGAYGPGYVAADFIYGQF